MDKDTKPRDVDLMDYWRVIVRRKWVLLAFLASVFILTAVFTFLATPQYRATSVILLEEETSRLLTIDDVLGADGRVVPDLRNYNTQVKLIKSQSLIERVAKRLDLPARAEFAAGRRSRSSLLGGISYLLTLKWLSGKDAAEDDASRPPLADPYGDIVKSLLMKISVSPVRETKLVELSFTSSSPELAREVVNTLADEFLNFSFEKRYSTTQQASAFLDETITNLRDDLGAKERELQTYSQEKDIVFLSETESAAVSTFASLSQARDQAMLERIRAEAEYRELTNLEGEAMPQFISDPGVQQLRTEYTTLSAEYQEKGRQLGPGHPEMVRIKDRLDSLRVEIGKAAESARARVGAARQQEGTITAQLNRQKGDVAKMKNNAILYNSIKSEVDSKRNMLNTLLQRQSETQLSAQLRGLSAGNISIIDLAETPRVPVSPKRKLNLIMALFVGLLGGVGLAFLFDYIDDTVKGPEDAERLTGLPSLGVIPYVPPEGTVRNKKYGAYLKQKYESGRPLPGPEETLPEINEIELINHLHPELSLAEDYRTVRTSILLSHAEQPPKSILLTSSLTQEGKTTTVVNLAVSFAQLDQRVLLVDGDLRKPRLHRLFKIRNLQGLTSYLTGKASLDGIIQATSIEKVSLVPSGPIPPNPAELLNSLRMKDMLAKVSGKFDIILLDSPPLLAVIDPVIIASICDSSILVVRGGSTRKKPFVTAVEALRKGSANIIGVIFNAADMSKEGAYYAKYYREYGYGTYGSEDVAQE